MANSLRAKIKQLRHKGKITQQEYDEIIKKLDGHDAKQLNRRLESLNRVIDILEVEISGTKKKIREMKEASVPSFEYIDKSRGYILGLRTAIKIILKERRK